jgi:hypothetical protein
MRYIFVLAVLLVLCGCVSRQAIPHISGTLQTSPIEVRWQPMTPPLEAAPQ